MQFVRASLRPLRRGGIAVHTTELNCSSNGATLDHISTVLPRARDFAQLAQELAAEGHRVAPLNFHVGESRLDAYVDTPPFRQDAHLKVLIGGYASTSFGLFVQKG